MAQKDFADLVKGKLVEEYLKEHSKDLLNGKWWGNNKTYPHILQHYEDNFLDDDIPKDCNIKGNLFKGKYGKKKEIGYHKGATSLNSSQIVCIVFFKKFFDTKHEEWQSVLLDALKAVDVPLADASIKNAVFEYVPDSKENTNFDFYMELDDGSHVSMEIKYTEAAFGGISKDKKVPQKYERKWDKIYKEYVKKCPYLDSKKYTENEFYKNYQINRNISHAKEGDIVLFITPRKNDYPGIINGREYIDTFKNTNHMIMNVYWEDLVEKLMKLIKNEPELLEYYTKFKKKYIDILKEI